MRASGPPGPLGLRGVGGWYQVPKLAGSGGVQGEELVWGWPGNREHNRTSAPS
ncbi:hypothetical protein [Methanothrix soehngenii]|uniref:hypothetical protein n=1 Tax=Methanothrix soehngenii TaxID=2223 RepID=UPI00300C5AA3